jgi:uncharacterized protein YacL
MSNRVFKQLFSVVFALIVSGLMLVMGVSLKTAIPESAELNLLVAVRELMKNPLYFQSTVAALGVVGLLLGAIIGPKLAQGLIDAGNVIERMSTRDKVSVGVGTFLGIFASSPALLVLLRAPVFGIPLYILIAVAFVYLGIRGMHSMKNEFRFIGPGTVPVGPDGAELSMDRCKILDTNVIIDGRILDVCRSGFVEGTVYVPGFVLDELQHIADSADSLKRARGRRGLDILNTMQQELPLVVRAYDHMLENVKLGEEVDAMLVRLAKAMGGSIVTNDFNLNKVAQLQNVKVLNVNELANALKPVVLPGEEMPVTIIKEGKEQNQGVAYLDDGTMIVVEDGRRQIGNNLHVVVTSVLQTVAGKMIFARIKGSNGESDEGHDGRGRAGGGPRYKIR